MYLLAGEVMQPLQSHKGTGTRNPDSTNILLFCFLASWINHASAVINEDLRNFMKLTTDQWTGLYTYNERK